jgi:hypothetical protein
MKKLLLPGVAALFLATGTAHADNEKWEANFRQCHIRRWFSKDELAAIGWAREIEGQTIVIEAEEIPDRVPGSMGAPKWGTSLHRAPRRTCAGPSTG